MADDLELKKANPASSAGKEFCELDETVVRFVSHDEASGEELVSPTVHAILQTDSKVLIGSKVAGGIIIRSMIGSGGMSSVYLGVQESIGREVAVKVMHAHLLSDDSALMRFKQEAQAVGRLDHTNIVKVHDFTASDNGNSFLVMDLVQGISLSEAIEQKGPLSPDRAINIFTQACDGLQHAHSKGIVHRDLKPSNIMLVNLDTDSEHVKVLDFGIAKILPQEGSDQMKLTQTGEVFGSPLYMSPEQCMGKTVDQRSDIYSMGCLIFEALTGKPPLEGANAFDTFFKHTTESPPSVKLWREDLPMAKEFDAIILKAMAKEPKDRYQSMSQLRFDLLKLNQDYGRGWLGKMSDDVELARRRFGAQRKRTLKSILVQAAVVLLVVGTAGGSWYYFTNVLATQSMSWKQLYMSGQDSFDRGEYNKATQEFESALEKAKLDQAKILPVLRELVDMQVAQGLYGTGNYEQRLADVEKERDNTISTELDDLVTQFKTTAKQNTTEAKAKLEELANEICDKSNLLLNPGIVARKNSDEALRAVIATFEGERSTDKGIGYARCLHSHASNLFFSSDYKGAIANFEKSARLKHDLAAKDPSVRATYVDTLLWVGQAYERAGDLDNAEKKFKECISEARNVSVDGNTNVIANNPKFAFGKFRLAEFYQYAKNDPKTAKMLVGEAIRVYEHLEKQESEEQANCYALLATIQLNEGNLNAAQDSFQRAHDLFQLHRQKNSSFWLETLIGLAECKYARKDYKAAEALYRRTLAVGLRSVFQYTPTVDKSLKRLDEISSMRGSAMADSMLLGQMRLKLDANVRGMNTTVVMRDYLYLHDLARKHNELSLAQEFLDQAAAVCQKTSGEQSWEWAEILLKRGQFNFDKGKAGEGEAAFEQMLGVLEHLKQTTASQKQLVKDLSFQLSLRMKHDNVLLERVKKLM